jgi:hypothetical protein
MWLLSTRDYHWRPWVVIDFKNDSFIEAIGAKEISIFGAPPKEPGLYVVRPIPEVHEKALEDFLWKCWAQEWIGIYIDEGYGVDRSNSGLKACLTQGRSKNIEMIICTQRPVWTSKMVFTEASFFAVFRLQTIADRKHVESYIDETQLSRLPKYHCLWYDTERQQANVLSPVPDRETILQTFHDRLGRKRVKI